MHIHVLYIYCSRQPAPILLNGNKDKEAANSLFACILRQIECSSDTVQYILTCRAISSLRTSESES